MVSRSDPGSFQRTTTCIWMPDVRLLYDFEPTQWGSVSGLDDGKRKTKRGWSPGDSLNLVRVLSVRVNYSQQCRNDINGRWEYSKSIITNFPIWCHETINHESLSMWIISHCHETMVCTVYLAMFFWCWGQTISGDRFTNKEVSSLLRFELAFKDSSLSKPAKPSH